MARPLGSGPIHVWIGFGPPTTRWGVTGVGPAAALYYGTTRQGPEIQERTDYFPVMNDITGPRQSMDEGFAGREDDIGLTMSSWTQGVENLLESVPQAANGLDPATRGTLTLPILGSLMLSEGLTIGIWMVKAAAGKAINVASGMPIGRYYPTCIMTGPHQKIEGNKENLMVRRFTAKKDIYTLNLGTLPLFYENNAAFVGLPAPTFG